MRFLLSIAVLVLSVLAYANAAGNMCSLQKECPADQYCDGSYCVDCLSHSDCGLDQYCSTNTFDYNKYGTCQKFDIEGKDCINLSQNSNSFSDVRVNNDSKCAITYFNYGTYPNQLSVDVYGQCINGKCRACNYATGNGYVNSPTSAGKGKPRTCVFPGKYESVHSSQWNAGKYYEDPLRVWLAIFFCLIVIQVLVGVFGIMKK